MKRTALTLLLSLLATLFIIGCASTPPPDSYTDASASARYDRDYIAAVEAKARVYGARVYWTKPPRKRAGPGH